MTLEHVDFKFVLAMVLGLPVALLIIARFRDPLVNFIGTVLDFLARPVVLPARIINGVLPLLTHSQSIVSEALRFSSQRRSSGNAERPPKDVWVGWDVLGSLVYLVLFLLFVYGDFWLILLSFDAMGWGAGHLPKLPISADMLNALWWAALLAFWGLYILDQAQLTPLGIPWRHLDDPKRKRMMMVLGIIGATLTLLAAASIYAWRQLLISDMTPPEPLISWTPVAIGFVLGGLLTLAAYLSGWALAAGPVAGLVIFIQILRIFLWVLRVPLYAATFLLRAIAVALVAVLDVPAKPGQVLHNWIASFKFPQNMHWGTLEFTAMPIVGEDIDEPLFVLIAGAGVAIPSFVAQE